MVRSYLYRASRSDCNGYVKIKISKTVIKWTRYNFHQNLIARESKTLDQNQRQKNKYFFSRPTQWYATRFSNNLKRKFNDTSVKISVTPTAPSMIQRVKIMQKRSQFRIHPIRRLLDLFLLHHIIIIIPGLLANNASLSACVILVRIENDRNLIENRYLHANTCLS